MDLVGDLERLALLLQPLMQRGGTSPHTEIKSPCSGPRFVPALAGIRRLVVQIKAIDCFPFEGCWRDGPGGGS